MTMRKRMRSNRLTWAGRRYAADKRGAAAIEFAIVAPVFLAFMFSIFEVGWFYFVNSMVDAAATNAARILRTGQAQQVNMTSGEFFNQIVCPKLSMLGNCSSQLTVEVKKYNSFSALAEDADEPFVCRDAVQEDIEAIPYQTAQYVDTPSIYRVRLCFLYKTLNPAIGMNLSQNELGQRKIKSTYILREEPYKITGSEEGA